MDGNADHDSNTAQRGEHQLLTAMTVAIGILGPFLPGRRLHAGIGDGAHDRIIRDVFCAIGDSHPAIEHVERHVALTHKRAKRTFEDGDFFGTIHAAHFEGAAAGKSGRLRNSRRAATIMRVPMLVPVPGMPVVGMVVPGVVVVVRMIVLLCRAMLTMRVPAMIMPRMTMCGRVMRIVIVPDLTISSRVMFGVIMSCVAMLPMIVPSMIMRVLALRAMRRVLARTWGMYHR
jgi:hypothetical protein